MIRLCGCGHGLPSRNSPCRTTRKTGFIPSRAASRATTVSRGCCMDTEWAKTPLRRDKALTQERSAPSRSTRVSAIRCNKSRMEPAVCPWRRKGCDRHPGRLQSEAKTASHRHRVRRVAMNADRADRRLEALPGGRDDRTALDHGQSTLRRFFGILDQRAWFAALDQAAFLAITAVESGAII